MEENHPKKQQELNTLSFNFVSVSLIVKKAKNKKESTADCYVFIFVNFPFLFVSIPQIFR